jgi:pimeloyl-ACP methyl ester carboxylesterase
VPAVPPDRAAVPEPWTWVGCPGVGALWLPEGIPEGGVVALSGAHPGAARQPLFEHLAGVLGPRSIAVLTYDRRPTGDGSDTPLAVQADDAVAAVAALRRRLGAPVGLFGFSQGAWAATSAAAESAASNLVVLGHCGVSPAQQMRFHVDELLRSNGFDATVRERAGVLRRHYEQALRGAVPRAAADQALAEATGEAWFPMTYLPPSVGDGSGTWEDMDHDPVAAIAAVSTPPLTIWGEREGVVPLEASRRAWSASPGHVQTVILPGCGHWPLPGRSDTCEPGWSADDPVSDDYCAALTEWYARVPGRGVNRRR